MQNTGSCCVRTWQPLPVCERSYETFKETSFPLFPILYRASPRADCREGAGLGGQAMFCPKMSSFVCRDLEEKQRELRAPCFAAESLRLLPRTMCPCEPQSPT